MCARYSAVREKSASVIVRVDDLALDPNSITVYAGEQGITLTCKEFAILEYLMTSAGKVVSQEELLEHVWNEDANLFTQTIKVHINNLRKKLKEAGREELYSDYQRQGLRGGGLMKIPSFMKTIRFRITLWYVSFFIILVFALVLVLNVKMVQTIVVTSPSGSQTISQLPLSGDNGVTSTLRNYSIIGVAIVIVVGAIGGYFLSGTMLKPIDKVTSVARRSSYSNLKERLSYTGPDDEIKRLADTFDDMLNRLDDAVESQKQFVQDASHELRTPIATALTNIEVLEMNSEATIADYNELTRVLKLSLDRMNNISNSLQLLSEDGHPTAQVGESKYQGSYLRSGKRGRNRSEKAGDYSQLETFCR